MTRDDLKPLMGILRSVYPHWELTSTLLDAWFLVLGGWDTETIRGAIREFLSKNQPFPPTPGAINEICEANAQPKYLRITAMEALEHPRHPIAIEAARFADRQASRQADGQFDSPEELARANSIAQARWRKIYSQRFDEKRDEIRSLIRRGMSEQLALESTLEPKFLANPARIALPEVKQIA